MTQGLSAGSRNGWRLPVLLVSAVAVLAGIFFRFHGLGASPFSVDEYYLASSITNVLNKGIPAFDCGGLYLRGVVLQYLSAGGQLAGMSAEFAPRFFSTVASLLAIPAAYLIARPIYGIRVGLTVIIMMALSIWEIEMARFGRMYAPFQAVFLWYMVFFLRYTVYGKVRAFWPMVGLSLLGPLVWEGGVFLPLANLMSIVLLRLPEPPPRRAWLPLTCCALLLLVSVWFVTADFRGEGAETWPPGYTRTLSAAPGDPVAALPFNLDQLRVWWVLIALIPAALVVRALQWIWTLRSRPLLLLGLVAMLACAAAHEVLLVGALGLLLMLTRLIRWEQLFSRAALPFHAAIFVCLLFWLAFGIISAGFLSPEHGSLARRTAMLLYQFLRVPDFVQVVVRPWAHAIPYLGAGLMLLVGAALYRAARHGDIQRNERTLLAVFLALLLAASASHPPRQETRYVFFLYPIALVIAVGTLDQWMKRLLGAPSVAAETAAMLIALMGFGLTEDFKPYHLLHINEPQEAFRLQMTKGMQTHLVTRDDYRAVARWLEAHHDDAQLVINDVHGLDHYFPAIAFFFVDQHDPNFPEWSCRRGTVERWGNYPLLNSFDAVRAAVDVHSPAYLVVFGYDIEHIMQSLAPLSPSVELTEGNIVVLKLQG